MFLTLTRTVPIYIAIILDILQFNLVKLLSINAKLTYARRGQTLQIHSANQLNLIDMNPSYYLPRKLFDSDRTYTETELLAISKYVVVLAEPGGGKSELMSSLGRQLGISIVTANMFRQIGANESNCPLLIDAFDELAKIDQTGIHGLLKNAREAKPTHVIISSRSSEWDSAATNTFKDFFLEPPLVVRLCEFDVAEQRLIFDHHVQGEDFEAFQTEVARFDLASLLSNPQFLKLFADAYIESKRKFTDKRSIFSKAVDRLAKEANATILTITPTLSVTQKIELSSEVFTKLLLSGSEGICTSEATENRMYPLLAALLSRDTIANRILATRLFKPGESSDQHRPVHKIVAEYCAANYLTKRIANPADPLTLATCLPIIAPNAIVRDELRGLLGWMAALGNRPIEEAAIKLDPYAVLANGDPSQLEESSKRLLINRLKDIEAIDPYFRKEDSWRRFSVAGFFTPDILAEVGTLLAKESDGHLRDLILELLVGSPEIERLSDKLRHIVISLNERKTTRLLANRRLLEVADYDHQSVLNILLAEGSITSLRITAETTINLGPESFERGFLANFFRACANLYPNRQEQFTRIAGELLFVTYFIAELNLVIVEWLLNELTKDLACVCGKKSYECDCRNGISKIVGSMLDRYFDQAKPPFDPVQVWQWVKNLNYYSAKAADQSIAVRVLQENESLRQGIFAHIFAKLTDLEQINEMRWSIFSSNSHSGISFRRDDNKFIVDLAFKTDNPILWTSFIPIRYQFVWNQGERGPDDLRRHMRKQALEKELFMREWAKTNRIEAQKYKREKRILSIKHNLKIESRLKLQDDIRKKNIMFIRNNRELVESGCHFNCLLDFANHLLWSPKEIEHMFDDEVLVRNALKNCFGFITPHVPNLFKLAELRCISKSLHVIQILYAACLETMRDKGNLEEIELNLLRALRTQIHSHFDAVPSEERNAMFQEIDRLIFPDSDSAENFLRQYVEPQLAYSGCANPDVWLLVNETAFSHLRATLSIEWLRCFRELALSPLDTLFEIAVQYGDRESLKGAILERCAEFMSTWPNPTGNDETEQKRTFWLVRAWYFLRDTPEAYWDWLKANKETLLVLSMKSGRIGRSEYHYWPKLTSRKVESILDAFIDKWPPVHLPSSYGTGSPKEENAYRFLTEVIWLIDSDNPEDALPVLDRLLVDPRYAKLENDLKSIRAGHVRKMALKDFEPPMPHEIVDLLDRATVITVEGLRQLVIQELQKFQNAIDGGEFNSADRFYEKGERLDEIRSTEIIAERLSITLEPQSIVVTPEHQLKDAKRSDFTVAKIIRGKRRLLVTEVKGQWNKDLYKAASSQLNERYSIHPDAEKQGIFLAIWFGANENVAGYKRHTIKNGQDLKKRIEENLSQELKGFIDVFVLDVSKSSK